MKRIASGFCVAAALSVATLGAQTPATSSSASTTDNKGEITVTGCLSKGADGKFVLNNAKIDSPAGATAGTSGSTTPSPTAGTSTASSPSANAAASWTLTGGSDLDKHVGHKIQVTGKAAMDNSSASSRMPDSPTAAGAAAGATAGAAGAGTVGTSGSTATAAAEEQRSKSSSSAAPALNVTSVKMVAATCS